MRAALLSAITLVLATPALPLARGSAPRPGDPKPRIPILAWIGPPAGETTVERYKELVTCGFTLNYSGFPDASVAKRALDVAHAAGVKQFLDISALGND